MRVVFHCSICLRLLAFFVALCPFSLSAQTNAALRRVADLNPGPNGSFPSNFCMVGNTLFFSAYTTNTGQELWKYNGQTITLVSNINDTMRDVGFGIMVGNDSAPTELTPYKHGFVFSAFDPRRGGEFWFSDGTNTVRLADINADANDTIKFMPNNSWPTEFTQVGSNLFFSANDGGIIRLNYELWQYNGVSTSLAAEINRAIGSNSSSYPIGLTAFKEALFFMANDGINGYELWRHQNGGGVLLSNINPGDATSSSYPKNFTPFQDRLLFQAYTDAQGFELWSTDGTNVTLLSDLLPGPGSSFPENFTVFNSRLYFSASDGVNGQELWTYDGATFNLVTNLNPYGDASPKNLTVFNDQLWCAATDGVHGWELWKFDGSEITLAADLVSGGDSFPEYLTPFDGALYFVATTPATGYEVWKHDGTSSSLVDDINPGPGSSFPQILSIFGNELVFRATEDGFSNWELWSLQARTRIPVKLDPPVWTGSEVLLLFPTEAGMTYEVQWASTLTGDAWQRLGLVSGTGGTVTVTHAGADGAQKFFRVITR